MKNIELTDGVVIPVMEKHKVSRYEAERRLTLLFESGILRYGSPDDPESQRIIDNFLAQDSETLKGAVQYERILNECLENKELVRQYDRLTMSNLTKALRRANAGLPPPNFKRQIEGFERFLEETVFKRMESDGI